MGDLLHASTPPAITTEAWPVASKPTAIDTASMPEQHWVSIEKAAQRSGRPDAKAIMRAGFPPAPSALPTTTASTACGSTPARANMARSTGAAISCGCRAPNAPPWGATALRAHPAIRAALSGMESRRNRLRPDDGAGLGRVRGDRSCRWLCSASRYK